METVGGERSERVGATRATGAVTAVGRRYDDAEVGVVVVVVVVVVDEGGAPPPAPPPFALPFPC